MQLTANGSILNLDFPHVMGILNVTPDSFSDGGRHNNLDAAIAHAKMMVDAGATILDIGGESTRPGAADVSDDEELSRVVPVVEALAKRFDVWLSVDTSKASVIRESAAAGAHLINDIRSLQEPGALQAAAETGLPVCLMHMQGEPKTMQHAPQYNDVVAEVDDYFVRHIAQCIDAGIAKDKLLLDPGFGFGKNLQHNYALLVGMSRKSMIGQLLNVAPQQRVTGSVACAVIAAMQGAQIIRVHDVKETVQAMRIVEATLSAKKG